jgi:PAS domain S-box-containing protein
VTAGDAAGRRRLPWPRPAAAFRDRAAVGDALRGRRPTRLLVAGGLLLAALVALDILTPGPLALISTFLLAPVLVALAAGPLETGVLAALALALAAVAGTWDGVLGDARHLIACLVVAAAGALSVLAAAGRQSVERNLARLALLGRVDAAADGAGGLEEAVERVVDLLVPALADVCLIETLGPDGAPRPLALRATGPEAEVVERALRRRRALPQEPLDPVHAIRSGQPALVSPVPDDLLRRVAAEAEDLAALRALRLRGVIAAPLRARGQALGALTLGAAGRRRYRPDDLSFAGLLADRVGLALDAAGLSRELSDVERRLRAILVSLAEAVLVQDAGGRTVYANQAAAELLGAPSPEALVDAPVGAALGRFELTDEAGHPVEGEQLPARRVFAGEREPTPLLVRVVDRATGAERFLLDKARGVVDEQGRLAYAVDVLEDVTEARRAELGQRLLAEAGQALGSASDPREALERLARVVVPALADWCGVHLPGPRDLIEPVAVAHVDPGKVALAGRLAAHQPIRRGDPNPTAIAIREGRPFLQHDVTDEQLQAAAADPEHLELLRAVGFRAVMVVPMLAGEEPVGALSFVSSRPGRRFDEADLALALELGRRAGVAVQHARLFAERAEIAHTLQAGLQPERLPEVPGLELAGLYRPAGLANEAGGDFYEVFAAGDAHALVLGDVAGKGAAAAAVTALARHTLHTAIALTGGLPPALGHLNLRLRGAREAALCSVAALLVRGAPGERVRVTVACAGHPQPLLVRDGAVTPVGRIGPMLGALDAAAWPEDEVELREGDALVLVTDGVTDAWRAGERFGEPRLHAVLAEASGPAAEIVARLDAELQAFQEGAQRDDIAVLALRRPRGAR